MNWNSIYFQLARTYNLVSFKNHVPGRRILCLHSIEDKVTEDSTGYWTISAYQFESWVNILFEKGDYVPKKFEDPFTTNEKSIAFSFDDGYRSNCTFALKILEKYRIPMSIFVSTKFVQDKHPDFLSPIEIKEISKHPLVTIGNHGFRHLNLTHLSPLEVENEIKKSSEFINEILGQNCPYFSYPHGGFNSTIQSILKKRSYQLALSSYLGINQELTSHPLRLKRIVLTAADTFETLSLKLAGAYNWYYLKQLLLRP
jgi:peptidoglycan/xylan/chitin deacetylase (PgdA/CDA1 family)